jgi:hypothetical protein
MTDAEYCSKALSKALQDPNASIQIPGPSDPEGQRRYREEGQRNQRLVVSTLVTVVATATLGPLGFFAGVITHEIIKSRQDRS